MATRKQDVAKFIEAATKIVNSVPPCTGVHAACAHQLSKAINLVTELDRTMQSVVDESDRQFKACDSHSTLNKQIINGLR